MQDWVRERLIKFLGDDVMKKMTKAMLMTALILGSASMGTVVEASELHEFTLDPMVVTASRMEKRDLDTAAAVDVITSEMVERNGGASAFEVLRHSLGVIMTSQGPNGVSLGSMTGEASIRGVERGTLVLMDGMPLNQDGKYNLEDIPSEIIDRIEIVRSGGSVLYGSEASGGVINIITKKNQVNKIKIAVGDLGRENYNLVVSGEKFGATAFYENRGEIDKFTTEALSGGVNKYMRYDDGDRKGIRWNYDINDNLTFYHQYSENKNNVSHIDIYGKYNNGVSQVNNYKDTDNNFTLNYDDKKGLNAHISYGTQEKDYYQTTYNDDGSYKKTKYLYSWRKGHNTNFDVSKRFDIGDDKFLIGATYKKEDMDIYSTSKMSGYKGDATYKRDTYSIYASYDWAMSDSDNLIINMRETFANNCNATYDGNANAKQKDVSEFTPEVQYVKKLNEDSSVYAKAGKSFRLPDITRIFGNSTILPSLDLYPEKGTHYELGYKLNEGNKAWRLALFSYEIEDAITKVSGDPLANDVVYDNVDTKNTGIELTCDIEHSDRLMSSFGVSYSNPKRKVDATDGWKKFTNRLQVNAAIDYQEEKFGASLLANYVGKRMDADGNENKVKPALYTDLHISYQPEKNQKIFLHVNNLFDREDFTTDTAPTSTKLAYITPGRNFMLGYEYSF